MTFERDPVRPYVTFLENVNARTKHLRNIVNRTMYLAAVTEKHDICAGFALHRVAIPRLQMCNFIEIVLRAFISAVCMVTTTKIDPANKVPPSAQYDRKFTKKRGCSALQGKE